MKRARGLNGLNGLIELNEGKRAQLTTAAALFLTGCLFRPVTDSTRHFVLAPIPADKPPPAATRQLSIRMGFVRMPSQLLQDSIAVHNGANEIEYFKNAVWAERLDHCFEQTLALNLSRLLSSEGIYLDCWGRDPAVARVYVNVQQFQVDTRGTGTLIAEWRITAPDSGETLKSGQASLARTGGSPLGNPQVVATTLSDLTADFSRELAQSIREIRPKTSQLGLNISKQRQHSTSL